MRTLYGNLLYLLLELWKRGTRTSAAKSLSQIFPELLKKLFLNINNNLKSISEIKNNLTLKFIQ